MTENQDKPLKPDIILFGQFFQQFFAAFLLV